MSLTALFDPIKARLPANVKQEVSAKAVYGQDGTPRVVWVPVDETMGPARGHAGDITNGIMFPQNPKSFASRFIRFECHIWSGSLDLTNELRDIVHNILQELMWGSYAAPTARWVNNDGATLMHGMACVMDVIMEVPVTRPKDFHLKVTEYQATCQMQFLNGNVEEG